MSHNVLIIEWEGGFDFIVVPAGSCPIEEDRCSLPSTITIGRTEEGLCSAH
jgi:hypothetical protein